MNENLMMAQLVIDRSGSMTSRRKDVIDGINKFIEDHKKLSMNVVMSIAFFDSGYDDKLHYTEKYHFVNVKSMEPLTERQYDPSGGTPLLAAVTKGIDELGEDLASMPEHERPCKVEFIIITDGQENTSGHTFSKEKLAAKIKHQTLGYKWEFVYLGANQDAFSEASGIGIMASNTANYAPTARGFKMAFAAASTSSMNYAGGLSKNVDFTAYKNQVIGENEEQDDLVEK